MVGPSGRRQDHKGQSLPRFPTCKGGASRLMKDLRERRHTSRQDQHLGAGYVNVQRHRGRHQQSGMLCASRRLKQVHQPRATARPRNLSCACRKATEPSVAEGIKLRGGQAPALASHARVKMAPILILDEVTQPR